MSERLPAPARLITDPHGASFSGATLNAFARHAPTALTLPLWPLVLHMQVRTHAIDETLLEFVTAGGRQVLILGAGYDCRALRFAAELGETRVFEVDHPATQSHKREVLGRFNAPSAEVRHVPWDFESRSTEQLPETLLAAGLDRSLPTLTIWEGVTMYLTEPAIEATFSAVRNVSAKGSPFVLMYLEKEELKRAGLARTFVSAVVALRGEPFRFGWDRDELPTWVDQRGFELERDDDLATLASPLLPAPYARSMSWFQSRVAVLRCKG